MRWLFICLAAGLAFAYSSPALSSSDKLDRYDPLIFAAVQKWWPRGTDHVWWKAQLYQESRLDPTAESPAGAQGLAQIMPGTWDRLQKRLKLSRATPFEAKPAIMAGAYYMADMYGNWTAKRPESDRLKLAQASYNAGLGNILAAQKACGGANLYECIITCLPEITGHHSSETINYVIMIEKHFKRFKNE